MPAMVTVYSYDNLGRVTGIDAGAGVVQFAYTYEPDENNIDTKTFHHRDPVVANDYEYDDLDRLTDVEYLGNPSDVEVFPMDDLGNRTGQVTQRDGTHTYSVDSLTNRYTQIDAAPIDHDEAGNLERDRQGYWYQYDYENRIVRIYKLQEQTEVTVATFEYDGLGRRIRKVDAAADPDVTTLYYYDPDWRCLEEYEGGTLDRLYVYGNYIDEVVLSGGSAGAYYTLHDHLYSAVALLDTGTGAVLERYEYDAYGTVHVLDASWNIRSASAYGNPYTFTGRRVDLLDTGALEMMYYRHRYYRPITARFLQRDMLGIGMHGQPTPDMQYLEGLNLYQYVLSAPTGGTDPGGLFKWWDCVACGAALFAKFGGAVGGAAAFCPRDNPNISWGECVSQVLSEYFSPCTLWEEFKKNPAEWVGAAACISCGVRLIEDITAPNPPPDCDDESEPDCPSDSGGRSQKCILDGIDPWLNKCIYACPDGSTVLSGTPPCFPFIIVDDEYRPPTWPF